MPRSSPISGRALRWLAPVLFLAATMPAGAQEFTFDWFGTQTPPPDPRGRDFLANCENLPRFCFAAACGRNQIAAENGCLLACPGAAILSVRTASCPELRARRSPYVVLRRRG